MKRTIILFLFVFHLTSVIAQHRYKDSLTTYQQKYVKEHGAVKGNDRNHLHFFPVTEKYRVSASVQKIYEAPWFKMETSGKEKKVYRVYAVVTFRINDTICKLHVYQSQQLMGIKEYADHLFIPFTDATTGEESYENGRYIDMTINDLESGSYILDFNKAYNPYCAYISDVYNCPIPPAENDLSVAIRAGEMKFGKLH
ncbi:MAG TPA: DUF1684 domain-containing protein [Chitinophagaceae bacterium]